MKIKYVKAANLNEIYLRFCGGSNVIVNVERLLLNSEMLALVLLFVINRRVASRKKFIKFHYGNLYIYCEFIICPRNVPDRQLKL